MTWWRLHPPPPRRRHRRRSTTSWMQPSELVCVIPLNCEGRLVSSCWTSQSVGHAGSGRSRLGRHWHKTWVHWPGGSRSFLSSCVHNPPVLFANRAGDLEAIEDYMAIGKGDLKDGEGRGALHYAVGRTGAKGGRQAVGVAMLTHVVRLLAARQPKHSTWACTLRSSSIGSQVLPCHPSQSAALPLRRWPTTGCPQCRLCWTMGQTHRRGTTPGTRRCTTPLGAPALGRAVAVGCGSSPYGTR